MTDILQQKIKDNKKGKNYTYSDMLIYNDLKNDNKIGPGLDLLREVYDKLYGFGLSLSGYQFIGLMVGEALIDDDTHYIFLFAYFMLAIGFIVSLFGSLLSFCMWQFITYIKTESPNYIIESIIKYKYELQLPHYILEINTFCFALPINILRQNPDIMKSVSQAAANNMANNIAREENDPSAEPMLNMMMGGTGMRPKNSMETPSGVDDILEELGKNTQRPSMEDSEIPVKNIEFMSKKKKNSKRGGIQIDI